MCITHISDTRVFLHMLYMYRLYICIICEASVVQVFYNNDLQVYELHCICNTPKLHMYHTCNTHACGTFPTVCRV